MKRWSDLYGDMQAVVSVSKWSYSLIVRDEEHMSEIPCRVSENEPVLANIGEARMTSCGGARVIPREVVPQRGIDPVSTEAKCRGLLRVQPYNLCSSQHASSS